MEKSNISGAGDKRAVDPAWFTGRTWMKVLSERIGSRDQDIYHVHFGRGSRTKLHAHNGNQVLIATGGRGVLEIFRRRGRARNRFGIEREQRIPLGRGDIVHVPSGTLHAHGSADKRGPFSHIAINVLPRGRTPYRTVWYESDLKSAVTGII